MSENEDNFDKFVEEIQTEIIHKEIEDFNEHIVELFKNPPNWGKPTKYTVSFAYKNNRNNTMEFFATIRNDIIEKINFFTDGCGATVATGSQTTLLLVGKSIEYAERLKQKDIDKALRGLPDDHKYSLDLVINSLKGLIKKYKNNKK
ncbi:MAG: iron-sulfur cluster assembly scaffold protein [Candidatus Heimdallarchaeota archaeon]